MSPVHIKKAVRASLQKRPYIIRIMVLQPKEAKSDMLKVDHITKHILLHIIKRMLSDAQRGKI